MLVDDSMRALWLQVMGAGEVSHLRETLEDAPSDEEPGPDLR